MKFKVVFLVCFITFIGLAQVVTTEPLYPTESDSIVINVDVSKASNKSLLGYTGTLYTHTGVNLSNGTTWQHVIGSWGNNTNQPILTRTGLNTYQLKIGKPRNFYNVTSPAEKITTLNFVFRSADGTKQTEDIFVSLYEIGLSVVLNSPNAKVTFLDPMRSPLFTDADDTININAKAVQLNTKVSSFRLYRNDQLLLETNQDSINYNYFVANYPYGQSTIKIVGVDTTGKRDSVVFAIVSNPVPQSIPVPMSMGQGITYINNNEVGLVLFAPYKKHVYVLGDFNDWKVDSNYLMNKYEVTPDSVYWWLPLRVNSGQEYGFQYLVDGELRIADPYSEKVLDPWNDEYVPSNVYPNLKPYPKFLTEHIVSVFQTNQPQYTWQVTDFQKPKKEDLVIYELHIRDFLAERSYKALEDTLSYLKNLGITAIELMPVSEFEGNESWGYNPSFHMALDKFYGTKNAFKSFIDKCHQNGIAVILDVVLNHAFGQNPMVRLYWNSAANKPAVTNPWFNPDAKHDFNVGYDFNHESSKTKFYVDKVNAHWLREFKIDGYRFDLSKGFTQKNTLGNTALWGQYDQSRVDILSRMYNYIKTIDPNTYVILEHLGDNPEEKTLANLGMMLWGKMTTNYNEGTMGYNENGKSNLAWATSKEREFAQPNLVTYFESHDEERLMFKNITYGANSGTYNVKTLKTALDRMKLAGAFFFPIPGPKMIWQKGELGYDVSIFYPGTETVNPCRLCNKPLKWEYYSDPLRLNLYKVWSYLIKLKTTYPAFETDNYAYNLAGAYKSINLYHPTMDVYIAGNFSLANGSMTGNFSKLGTWYDYFSGDSITINSLNYPVNLKAGEFKIYTTERLPLPEQNIISGIFDNDNMVVKEYSLEQNYPNPFNPSTNIRFSLVNKGMVKLNIYNILGEKVAQLLNEVVDAGRHVINFDAGNLPSGMYIYKLETEGFTSSKKMVLVK